MKKANKTTKSKDKKNKQLNEKKKSKDIVKETKSEKMKSKKKIEKKEKQEKKKKSPKIKSKDIIKKTKSEKMESKKKEEKQKEFQEEKQEKKISLIKSNDIVKGIKTRIMERERKRGIFKGWTRSWWELSRNYRANKDMQIMDLFENDPMRAQNFSIEDCGLLLDYSKNKIDQEIMELFFDLLKEIKFKNKQEEMFAGKKINTTEDRAVLHVALRNGTSPDLELDNENIKNLVEASQEKIKNFVNDVHVQNLRGYSGKPFRYVVNIGIGGSDLGPHMVTQALLPFHKAAYPQVFFVSNVDGEHIHQTLKKINIEETLFIIASKTFTTQETMTNAHTARLAVLDYFLENKNALGYHFIALSTNVQEAMAFGIKEEFIFGFWDWVGGRFSLWSAIGISIALSVGYQNFEELLAGAKMMDEHFLTQEPQKNMPIILALLSVWYNNFFKYETHAVLPYEQNLSLLPAYLQQAQMESNGKSVQKNGEEVNWQTSSILWGEAGTNGQHAFYQLIHQGTKIIPCDFIGGIFSNNEIGDHHLKLVANLLAQPGALLKGKDKAEVLAELKAQGKSQEQIEQLLPHKVFEGNRPSTTILYQKLTPKVLGSLIALYEHKIFTEGIIWNINSFDQWGVELGKQLATGILSELKNEKKQEADKNKHDASTAFLLEYILKHRSTKDS